MKNTKLFVKFTKSTVFPEVIYCKNIPGKLIVFENNRYNLIFGRVSDKEMRYERGKKIISSYTRLDTAKLACQNKFYKCLHFRLDNTPNKQY